MVREFIARYLPSIDHLDALLLLARDESRSWSSEDAAVELHDSLGTEKALSDLVRFGLVEFDGSAFRYRPATDALRATIAQLAELNREHPVSLVREIYRQPSSARFFSDAFRLRRGEDDSNG